MPQFEKDDIALTKIERGDWQAMSCVMVAIYLPAGQPVQCGPATMIASQSCYLCSKGGQELTPYLPDELMPLSNPPPEETLDEQLERQHGVSA